MYFELLDFYKRDVIFDYSEERNPIGSLVLRRGQSLNIDKPLEFEVDKIDSYIESYDLLPTYDTPLVSTRFKKIFSDLTEDIQFIDALIIDKKNKVNDSFYFMNILTVLPIMDKNRSIFEIRKRGEAELISIKKLYVIEGSLKGHSIVRMKEHKSFIIVTEKFKKRCEGADLKGIDFTEEGYSIYTDLD